MFRIVNGRDQKKGAIAAVEFEGHPYGAGISFFQGNIEPGKGPGLHKHPYPETCIVFSGRAAVVVDGQHVMAAAGDVVLIGPETPHRFTAIGDEPLVALAIHASDRFIIENLGD
jgi:quercetin dioxygenase-like cupin family protein